MKNYIFLFIILFFFTSCAKKSYLEISPYIITIKTNNIKTQESGFVKIDNESVKLEIYSLGSLLYEIFLSEYVCINKQCLEYDDFNARFFSLHYNSTFLRDIIQKKELALKLLEKKDLNGVVEYHYFDEAKYDISYKISEKDLFFKDKKNKIIISLRSIR